MLKRILILLPVLLLLAATSAKSQNSTNWPKTFLWRISGNGLTKDSYLYGTMHLQDKRLFNFGDSLYRYLEKAEGYALEIDLSELTDSMIQRVIDEKTGQTIEQERLENTKEKKWIIDSLVTNVKKQKDKTSRKILEKMRREKLNAILKKDMPTVMDAFLFGIARRQGKWLGGIEDLQDQLPLLDELGAEIESDEILSSPKELSRSMEKMIGIYASKDLNQVESFYITDNAKLDEDFAMVKRNNKMARRMDSLAHIRSMFFTVGVAHLPGNAGVIKLLREKGFNVDPVFSTNAVDPLQYVSTLHSLEWQKLKDDNGAYEIEMPGKASEANIITGMIKMKYYVDLSTLSYFMITNTIVAENLDLNWLLEKTMTKQGSKLLSKKNIEVKGIKGIEAEVLANESYLRTQYLLRNNMLYMLIAGGQKKETMKGQDANRFLTSFLPSKELPATTAQKAWKQLDVPGKGCTVSFPGDVRKNGKLIQGYKEGWNFSTYDYADPAKGGYFLFQVRDLAPGYHIEADSNIFSAFRQTVEKSMKTSLRDEVRTLEGFPALYYDGEEQNGVIFKSIVVNRGNRCYYLIVEGHNNPSSLEDMNNFLRSFKLLDYPEREWKRQVMGEGNFHSSAPGAFDFYPKEDSTSTDRAPVEGPEHFTSYDSLDGTSYDIFKTKLSPYYYIQSDSAFFNQMGSAYYSESDSVLVKKWVGNGNLKGMEWTVQTGGSNNLKRFRLLLNGDTVYTLISFIPSQYADKKIYGRFFEDFRVIKEDLNPSIYKSKVKKILTDLLSSDSAIFSDARIAFRSAKFTTDDKIQLEQALLKDYSDDNTEYVTARSLILDTLARLADNKTVDYFKGQYAGLTGNREFLKLTVLNLLSNYRTRYSYEAMGNLIVHDPPKTSGESTMLYGIDDSLELTASLFPQILKLSDNPIMAVRLMGITSKLLEKKLIPVSMVQEYKARFIHTADTSFETVSKSEDYWRIYEYIEMLNLMQQLNDGESNRVLKKYLRIQSLDIKQTAIECLLKNGQAVEQREMEKVAMDKSYRIGFYENLKKLGKSSIFPAAYNTQQSMAEADIYSNASEDAEPVELKPVGVKTVKYDGKSSRVYLFRITFEWEDEDGKKQKESYLGLSGPFSTNNKELLTDSDLTTIFWSEKYDAKQNDRQVQEYIKTAEAASKETEE